MADAAEIGQTEESGATIEQESAQYTEVETQAMEDGWIPPDRFDKADVGKDFISAEKFVENGSFFKKISAQKKEIDDLKVSFGQLKTHHDRVAENEHKKAEKEYEGIIEQLKNDKVTALDEGDNRRVVEIDDQIRTTEKPVKEEQADPVFDGWLENNSWYSDNKFLSVEADMVAEKYLGKGLRGIELLDAMTDHMKIAHKDKFEPESRARPAAVEGDTRGGQRKTSKSFSEKDLSSDEREVFNNFNRMGLFKDKGSKEKYLKEVNELRD